jgi:hypothetical protein
MDSYVLPNNYIYLYHTDEWLVLPEYPDTISDKMNSTFGQTNALSRTAPVYTYSNSGPREVNFQLHLHRDMLKDVNVDVSNLRVEIGEDYVDALIRSLQSIALPKYNAESKEVVPPMIALKLGNEIFVKGVVVGGVSIDYAKPIMDGDRYAQATLSFTVYEVTPYDADSVAQLGSFRGITETFKNGIFKS